MEHELRKAPIVTVIYDAQSVLVEAIFDAMVSSFSVERSTFKIVPAGVTPCVTEILIKVINK
jgi:hypothetical protein